MVACNHSKTQNVGEEYSRNKPSSVFTKQTTAFVSTYLHIYTHTHGYMHACIDAHAHTNTQIHLRTHSHRKPYTHAYMHTIHSCTQTSKQTNKQTNTSAYTFTQETAHEINRLSYLHESAEDRGHANVTLRVWDAPP